MHDNHQRIYDQGTYLLHEVKNVQSTTQNYVVRTASGLFKPMVTLALFCNAHIEVSSSKLRQRNICWNQMAGINVTIYVSGLQNITRKFPTGTKVNDVKSHLKEMGYLGILVEDTLVQTVVMAKSGILRDGAYRLMLSPCSQIDVLKCYIAKLDVRDEEKKSKRAKKAREAAREAATDANKASRSDQQG